MNEARLRYYKTRVLSGIILVFCGFYLPFVTQTFWFGILNRIRGAIKAGDSGHLILASASINLVNAVQITFFFLGAIFLVCCLKFQIIEKFGIKFLVLYPLIIVLDWLSSEICDFNWEYMTSIISVAIALILFEKVFSETYNFLQVSIVSVQVFFAFQWLNIMPMLREYSFGRSDIPLSIKVAGIYLGSETVLNFTGAAFFLPFISSAFITTILFISYAKNIKAMEENHEKERKLQYIKVRALENRLYQELHSLVHDLKTPLATIRGLNSLLPITDNKGKLQEYFERIENSVVKMNEMISGILYESARQKIKAAELVNYIRAQLPLEDETIQIRIRIDENLPPLYVNKVRVARAIINLLENAIIAPCKKPYKLIQFEVIPELEGILVKVTDNGEGIEASELPNIWEAGYSTRNTSGLGLPFAKQIIENHMGWIDIKSQQGVGTTVTLYLPANTTQ